MHDTALLAEPDIGPLFAAHDGGSQEDEALRRISDRTTPRKVAEVAEYFAAVTPDAPMTESARLTTAVMVTGSAARVRPLLRHLPLVERMPAGTSRGDYARHLMGGEGDLPPSPIHVPGIPQQPERSTVLGGTRC